MRWVRLRVVAALTGIASLLRRLTGAPPLRGGTDGADQGAASTSAPDVTGAPTPSILRDGHEARGRELPPQARYARYLFLAPAPTPAPAPTRRRALRHPRSAP
ncbi:hypothetical protein GCM10010245_67760 [Streptomyces spectabilis]|nr:hypothetical protein GCM10010245_67760 [Streptomyces spectabilis]